MDCLSLDIGATRTKWALFRQERADQNPSIVGAGAIPTPSDPGELMAGLRALGITPDRLAAAFAGVVSEGRVIFSPNLPAYGGFPLESGLSDSVGIPALVANDADCFTLGEALHGAARGLRTVVGLTLGTGIGGGMVVGGEIHRGAGFAGEAGHMVIDPDGPVCGCGRHGCLEALLGEGRFASRFGYRSALEAYEAKDAEAWDFYGTHLGIAVANLVNFLDPDAVVLGGGVSAGWDLFSPSMLAAIQKGVVAFELRKTAFLRSELGGSAGLWGGIVLASRTGD